MTLSSMMMFGSVQQMVDDLFFGKNFDTKPPCVIHYENDSDGVHLKRVLVQYALAGFREEDIKVSYEKNILSISGNNSQNVEVAPKFRCHFSHEIPVNKSLSLETSEVSFKDGLLTISIPVCEEKSTKKFLFGK